MGALAVSPVTPHNNSVDQKKGESSGYKGVTGEREKAIKKRLTKTSLVGAAGLGVLGLVMKDGLSEGAKRIGEVSTGISNLIGVTFSLLVPFVFLNNEHKNLLGKSATADNSLLNRMVYSFASLSFAPVTFAKPFLMATKSTKHMIATIANLPHILFTGMTYTGGRFLGCLKAAERALNDKPENDYRLEQQFNALYYLGNIGSAQASIIPQSAQFIEGWETISNIVQGDFSNAWDKFKHNPINTGFGTLFNSWMWIPDWFSKVFDTTLRTMEGVESYQNAFGNPDDSMVINGIKKMRNAWHTKAQDRKSTLGKVLFHGRELAKSEALLIPPIGMASVVLPESDKYFRGEVFNEAAQEVGGLVGFFDKAYSSVALLSNMFYSTVYGLTVRLPQTITSAIFFGTNMINRFRGVDVNKEGHEKDTRYVDPLKIRNALFNKKGGIIDKITTFAEKRLNSISQSLTGKDAVTVDNEGRTQCKHINNFVQVMAREVIWDPTREVAYNKWVHDHDGRKPTTEEWGTYVEENKIDLHKEAGERWFHYLRHVVQLSEEQIDYMRNKESTDWWAIADEVEELIQTEIDGTVAKEERTSEERGVINGVKIPDTFSGLLTNPKALLEVIKLRTFHNINTFLPLNVRGFVNVVDYGREGEAYWFRKFKAQETGMRVGDYDIATKLEFMPVVNYAFQSMGLGMVSLHRLKRGLFNGEGFNIFSGLAHAA